MNPTVPAALDSESWRQVLDLASHEESGRVLVERLVVLLREALAADGAALYLRGERGFERELSVGSGEFPEHLERPAAEGLVALEVPGGVLLLTPDAGPSGEPGGGLAVALAAAVRALLLEKRLKQQRFEVAYRGVELEALYDVGLAIASTLNLEQLSEEILLRAMSLLDARRAALYLIDGESYRLHRSFGGSARKRVEVDDPQIRELLAGASSEGPDLLPGASHLLATPIEVDGRARGLLVAGDKESRRGVGPFPAGDRRTLALFANQAAIALENAHLHRQALEKERLEREAELAADIQRRLLPERLPVLQGLEIVGWSRPARHVGGDYYDLVPLAGGRLATLVADVTGKGMPAALMVSTLYSALRLLLDREGPGPELMARLNHHIHASSAPNTFITLLLASVDPADGRVDYLNAGHNPAFLVRARGGVEELRSGGLPIGILADGSCEARSVVMEPGDLLCFYSDGITESESPEDEDFGEERLLELLRSHADRPLAEVVAEVDLAVTEFARGLPQADDQTLVLLRKL